VLSPVSSLSSSSSSSCSSLRFSDFGWGTHKQKEGVFRLSGSINAVAALRAKIEKTAGKKSKLPSFEKADVHVLAAILKQWLRELPEPIMTFDLYESWVTTASFAPDLRTAGLKSLVGMLPAENRAVLAKTVGLLYQVTQLFDITKMNAENLAICMAPNLMRPEHETLESIVGDNQRTRLVVAALTENYLHIFQGLDAVESALDPSGAGQQMSTAVAQSPSAPLPANAAADAPSPPAGTGTGGSNTVDSAVLLEAAATANVSVGALIETPADDEKTLSASDIAALEARVQSAVDAAESQFSEAFLSGDGDEDEDEGDGRDAAGHDREPAPEQETEQQEDTEKTAEFPISADAAVPVETVPAPAAAAPEAAPKKKKWGLFGRRKKKTKTLSEAPGPSRPAHKRSASDISDMAAFLDPRESPPKAAVAESLDADQRQFVAMTKEKYRAQQQATLRQFKRERHIANVAGRLEAYEQQLARKYAEASTGFVAREEEEEGEGEEEEGAPIGNNQYEAVEFQQVFTSTLRNRVRQRSQTFEGLSRPGNSNSPVRPKRPVSGAMRAVRL
jgi:RhoGAP domain